MRRGSQDSGFITPDTPKGVASQIIGLNLGYDFCAEHE